LTLKAANRRDEKFGCHLCTPKQGRGARSKPSEWEIHADAVIRAVFPNARVVTQTKVLPCQGGAVDFMLEWGGAGRLLVEVDGEQHHRGGYHGLRHEVQRSQDGDKDEAALELGVGLARLHCWDTAGWERRLKAAKKLAQRKNKGFVLYSASYKRKDIVL
jgi:very-short-patch-repair endonuclease